MRNRITTTSTIIVLFILIGQLSIAQAKTYQIDAENSRISFSVAHLGIMKVVGIFQEVSGNISFDGDQLITIESRVFVNSINTSNKNRDKILVEESYFNADEFPFISFKSNRITTDSITGILTLRGMERRISMPFQKRISKTSGLPILTMKFVITREDFELHFGSMDSLIGNKIAVGLEIAYLKD